MASGSVAVHATDGVRIGRAAFHQVVHEVAMALDTALLKDPAVLLGDLDRFVEILQREGRRVTVTVLRLGQVLANETTKG